MTIFTRLGAGLWDWEPWTELFPVARILWLALYTSSEAKRNVTGLWQGGIPAMADAARLAPDDVISALDQLLEREMVEYDRKLRVLRLCDLPDPGEHPHNGKVILSWWRRFQTVPVCPVRDAHVRTLAWVCHEGCRLAGKTFTPDHQTAWDKTFGTIVVPPKRRRGVRTLADSDTSTQRQPSLFPPNASSLPSGSGGASQSEPSYPQIPQPPVDNSAALHQSNKNNIADTVCDTVCDTVRIPDPDSGSGSLDLSGEGERGRARPLLTLVPPYAAAEVLRVMGGGKWDPAFDRSHQNALSALIPVWVAGRIALDDFRLLADYSRHSGTVMSARFLAGCDLVAEIQRARQVLDWRDVRMASMLETLP
jgi:hypothetical protein